MALVKTRRPGDFNFTWSIRNFSRCNKQMIKSLFSPVFYVGSIPFKLELYPEGRSGLTFGFISLHLHSVDYKGYIGSNCVCKFVLSLIRCNGRSNYSNEYRFLISDHQSDDCVNFVSIDKINELGAYSKHDVLTLGCRVRLENYVSQPSVDCFAKTEIKIAQLNYRWILEDLVGPDGILKHKFKRSTGILNFSSRFSTIKIHVSTGETFDDDSIYLEIEKKPGSSTPLFSVYNIHLLDSYGSKVHCVRGEALFQNSNETQKFPFIAKRKLLSNSELYLQGGKLTLQCELSFSGDLVVNCVEFGKTNDQIFNSEKPNEDSVSDGHQLWKKNMQQFYLDGEFTDLLVRTPNREFPVHRAILCAQSEVFRKMLSHDLKENNSGVIEIEDFEDDTVSKLLLYLYTNSLEGVDYALAKDLYFAADKYQITPLQKICSNRLIESTDASNVCDILLLADQLRDDELKSKARNVIASSPYEIMNSGEWKNLVETNPHLTSDTMQLMIFINFLSHKK